MAPNQRSEEGDVNPRTCIVSRTAMDRSQLIRFVAAPDGRIVPDLKENLPGRGVWVEASRGRVEQAVERKLFEKALGQGKAKDPIKDKAKDTQTVSGLTDTNELEKPLFVLVEELLEARALQALALAKKSGLLVTGFAKVDSAIRSNKADILIHATDAADDGKRKLSSATSFVHHMGGETVKTVECWSSDQMNSVLGLGNVMHAAAMPGGATRNLIAAMQRLQKYREPPQKKDARTGKTKKQNNASPPGEASEE